MLTSIQNCNFYAFARAAWQLCSRHAIHPSVGLFVCYQTCKHNISKTNKIILIKLAQVVQREKP